MGTIITTIMITITGTGVQTQQHTMILEHFQQHLLSSAVVSVLQHVSLSLLPSCKVYIYSHTQSDAKMSTDLVVNTEMVRYFYPTSPEEMNEPICYFQLTMALILMEVSLPVQSYHVGMIQQVLY